MKETLKEIRIKNGYTTRFIANYLGIKRNTLYLKESGKRKFNIQEIQKLLELYQIELEEINI